MKRVVFIILLAGVLSLSAYSQPEKQATATGTAPEVAKVKKPTFRSTKEQITEAQTMLKTKSLYSGEATGKTNPDWKTAVKTYQGDNGLTKTGSLNRATIEKMGIALTDKQKLIPVSPKSFAKTPSDSKTMKSDDKPAASTKTMGDGPKRPAPFRANKEQVMAAQKILREGKMLTGGEDGKLDDLTRDSLKKYKEANGLKVTTTLNAETLEKMGIALTDGQKANVAAHAAFDAAKTPKN